MDAIDFDTDFAPVPGRAERISPLVRRLVCNNPSPFTFTGTNTYIVGTGEVAVIDPGPDDSDHWAALMAALNGETVSHILVTHTHRDHSPLARRLKQATGAPTLAFGPHGSGRVARAKGVGGPLLDASGDLDFVPDIALADGDAVKGRDFTLTAVFTPGHTSNHMAFRLDDERALFSGDHVMSWATSVIAPPDGHMAQYMASLRRLLHDADDRLYWPGHGPGRADPQVLVRAILAHRQMREAAVLERILSGDRTIPAIVARIYAAVDPRLHGAAALSTLAHVEHLVEQGKVSTEGELSLESEYHPVGKR
jgi:glyoxylase-like metal-dependent hydrolase (beta-lactamase superfamily II)